ncbi:hypothetical protein GW17_00013315 [Ensete ventricosum]|nr:hypothetical protein GW17_00013315 [Ensete ventricosum]
MINNVPLIDRFEPDMLAFSGCYYGGGEKERTELGAIRKRWKNLHVSLHFSVYQMQCKFLFCYLSFTVLSCTHTHTHTLYRQATRRRDIGMVNVHLHLKKSVLCSGQTYRGAAYNILFSVLVKGVQNSPTKGK